MFHDLLADIAMTMVLDSTSDKSMDDQDRSLFSMDFVFLFVNELEI